jgi:acyl carrier protein phosphodiesterase
MNYLAHAYLSFGVPQVTAGNLISDFVKGKKKYDYPPAVLTGIQLHRAIDSFTDTHPVTRQAKLIFREAYKLYSGPLVDIVYDHFLANDPLIFPGGETGLKAFAQKTYEEVGGYTGPVPEPFIRLFHYMRTQDWLSHYRYKQGIVNSFKGLARRAVYMGGTDEAALLFESNYGALEDCYRDFFPELQEYALRTLQQLQEGRN